MQIHESAENYLETILILTKRGGAIRSVDIAAELGFTKPSISRAMKALRENNYIEMDEDNLITLTKTGREVAEKVYERHQLLTNWLVSLGVDWDTADADACRIEHVISAKSFEKIKDLYLSNKQQPNG